MNNRLISAICPDNNSSYNHPIVTFDIDWAHDEVLTDTINLVEEANVSAVWFVTHPTGLIDRLRRNPYFEVGIHPNLNGLHEGDFKNGKTAKEIVDRLISLVPEAKSVRSHSLTQSSRLSQLFLSKGLTHEANDYIPASSGITLLPWQLETGLIKVPYFWTDELECFKSARLSMLELVKRSGLRVFDFHPIHVFLNTEHLDRYESTRHLHHIPDELIKHRFEGVGTRTRLLELLKLAETLGIKNE